MFCDPFVYRIGDNIQVMGGVGEEVIERKDGDEVGLLKVGEGCSVDHVSGLYSRIHLDQGIAHRQSARTWN